MSVLHIQFPFDCGWIEEEREIRKIYLRLMCDVLIDVPDSDD